MSGITKKDKLLLWLVIIWALMTGGPGLYLADRPEFVAGLPVLYIYCVLGWFAAIALHVWIVKSASFVNLGDIEKEVNERERLAAEAAFAAVMGTTQAPAPEPTPTTTDSEQEAKEATNE